MYDELVKRLHRYSENCVAYKLDADFADAVQQAADAIEALQATLCNWCAVCPEDKRDLSTCEIYESCRTKPTKEE